MMLFGCGFLVLVKKLLTLRVLLGGGIEDAIATLNPFAKEC